MKGWIEIFRAGKHTDSKGRVREWANKDLDQMVKSYDPANHEAPAVIGHPKSNAPAYGWVKGLKRVGTLLMAKFKQVEPQFTEMVQEGRFKKRSISVYPDGRLRHVGFLGAAAPALAGLKDIAFNDADDFFEYEQPITTEEAETMTKEEFERQLALKEAELATANQKATDFEAQAKASDKKVTEAEGKLSTQQTEFAEQQTVATKKEISEFIEAGIKEGTLLPIWKEQGLARFMAALEESDSEYEFTEGKKQAPAAFFREFLEGLGKHPLFKEMVKSDDDKGTGGESDFEELGQQMADMVNQDSDDK